MDCGLDIPVRKYYIDTHTNYTKLNYLSHIEAHV